MRGTAPQDSRHRRNDFSTKGRVLSSIPFNPMLLLRSCARGQMGVPVVSDARLIPDSAVDYY